MFYGEGTLGQDSLNMKKMANLTGLGSAYNDVWGYTKGSNEYAILGSNIAINIVNVTNCSNPTLEHQWIDGGSKTWRDFKDYGDYVYGVCDSCNEGLQSINKNTYAQFQSFDEFESAHNIYIDKSSGRLYVAGSNSLNRGLYIYDLNTSPNDPPLLAAIDFQDWDDISGSTNWYVHDLYVRNDTAYCSHGYRGHAVWDMTDLSDVKLVGTRLSDPGYNHSSWVHETLPYEYVAREVPNGMPLQVYDNSDWSDIEVVGTFQHTLHSSGPGTTNSTPHNPYVHENKLYVSNYHDGLKVYDLHDPVEPILQAYYDTYPINNGSYSGYEGNWGTYPFLPSGCILASDISFGLYTFNLTESLKKELIIENSDVILTQAGAGIIFYSEDTSKWKWEYDDTGSLSVTSIPSIPTVHTQSENMTFSIKKPGGKIYLKNSNGKTAYISIANDGSLVGPIIDPIPLSIKTLIDQDLVLSTNTSDFKLVSPDGSCFRLTVSNTGVLNIDPISCD